MRDLNQMYQDIVTVAQLAGVEYSEALIKEALQLFSDGFARGSVQFKVTTKPPPKRHVNFRYTIDLDQAQHPQDIAWEAGLLPEQGEENRLLTQIREVVSTGRGAADFEVSHGLVKLWHYPKPPFTLECACQMPSLPDSVVANADFFRSHHFDEPPILGVDYFHHSVNLYFMNSHPQHHTSAFVKEILQEQSFALPPDLIIRYCAKAAVTAFTFRWDTPQIERMCFYVTPLTRRSVPSLHPLLTQLSLEAPFLVDTPRFQVSWSFGGEPYLKMDIDYTGDVSI